MNIAIWHDSEILRFFKKQNKSYKIIVRENTSK
jgi:hypothetical protein